MYIVVATVNVTRTHPHPALLREPAERQRAPVERALILDVSAATSPRLVLVFPQRVLYQTASYCTDHILDTSSSHRSTMVVCTPTKLARIHDFRDPRFGKPKSFTAIGQVLGIDRRTVARNLRMVAESKDNYFRPSRPGRPRAHAPTISSPCGKVKWEYPQLPR